MPILAPIGRIFLAFLAVVGRVTVFAVRTLFHCVTPRFYFRLILKQMCEIGYFSLPVVAMTTLFAGMVLALQSYSGFSRFSAESAVATVVVISITRELGPVLAGLMVAGRVGAAIDALVTLSTNPFKYLVVPRVIAGIVTLPILVFIGDILGVLGGYMVGVNKLSFNSGAYIQNTFQYLETLDVVSGLVKATIFGFLITLMGCYHGYYSRGGAQGVGQATTNAVVSSSILILIANYIVTELFFVR